MNQSCVQCRQTFSLTAADKEFLKKLSPTFGGKMYALPEPTHCPDCRAQRRQAQANQLHLYKRTCDFSKKSIISSYHPSAPYPVYNFEAWWGDKWDATDYGRAFDFKRPFFEQWQELSLKVPRYPLHTTYEYDENSEYVNYCTKNKNCYLIFDSDLNRDCYYSYSVNRSEDCSDCYRIGQCQLCYESVDVTQSYNCRFTQDCHNCSGSAFLKNCIGCKNCLFCSNLRNKEYCIENKQVSKEAFEAAWSNLASAKNLEEAEKHFGEWRLQFPEQALRGVNNEEVSGNYLVNSKNAYHCFDSRDLWDCRYNNQGWMATKDSMDTDEVGDCELFYESCFSGAQAQRVWFSSHCFYNHDLLYCMYCPHSADCFGCIGLKRKKYCILNKEYSKEEYEALVPKIIEHMRSTKEWGEFFPVSTASFAYNESLAQNHFPLTKEEALARGYNWRDDDQRSSQPSTFTPPDAITEVSDDATQEILACRECKKNYRITSQELELLRRMDLPIPARCFFCRHTERFAKRTPRRLFDRTCMKCKKPIVTAIGPERPDIVFCEECYLASVS